MDKIEIDSPDATSEDGVAENIRLLGELFPELLTEGPSGPSVNVDVLKQLVGDASVTEVDEKYGMSWFGKREARKMALTPSLGTLLPCPDESEDWDATKNLMIEGDNLEVLKLLQKSYSGKVDLIYIDPPYNTGKDFVYRDNYQDNIKNYLEQTVQTEDGRKIISNTESSGRFHTHWLNMMYPRLKLAQKLLSEGGLLFVSIDDNEQDNLKKLCDEIFGEENFVAIAPRKTGAGSAATRSESAMRKLNDFVLIYTRTPSASLQRKLVGEKEYPFADERGEFMLGQFQASGSDATRSARPNMWYPIYVTNDNELTTIKPSQFMREIVPKQVNGEDGRWLWRPEKFESDKSTLINFDGKSISRKIYFDDEQDQNVYQVEKAWFDEFRNATGTKEVEELFGEKKIFDHPKPLGLISHLIALHPKRNALVLDFFAGSGTTGHAVFELNSLDGGHRSFILVQLPEPLNSEAPEHRAAIAFCSQHRLKTNIASVTAERLRRAGAKIRSDNSLFAGDVGFRVFKLAGSNIRAWDPFAEDLEATLHSNQDHLVEGRSDLDVLYEVVLKRGLDLCVPIEEREIAEYRVSAVGGGVLFACLESKIEKADVEALAEGIVAWRKEIGVVGDVNCIFRDSSFDTDVAKSNLSSILEQSGFAKIQSL